MKVPAGAIPPKVPRDLTEDERALVLERRAEALANSGKLEGLETRDADKDKADRMARQRAATKAAIKGASNLYVKDEE